MSSPLYAITIYPEWVWAITRLGKDAENRTWRPRVALPFHLALHAGARFGGEPIEGAVCRPRHLQPVVEMARRAGWSTCLVDGTRGGRRAGGHGLILDTPEGEVIVPLPPTAAPQPPTRAIVAVVRVVEVARTSTSPWAVPGLWAWRFDDLVVLPQPVPARGSQGLWIVPTEILDRVRAGWVAARRAA